jgi:hypothetical protein
MPESTLGHDPHGRTYARDRRTFEGRQQRVHVVLDPARGLDFRLTAAF